MSEGKRAKSSKSSRSNKNRLEKEVELEKTKSDKAYESSSFDKTGEIKVITDEDIARVNEKELSTKEKIYKALEEETHRIEFEDVDEEYAVYNEVKKETSKRKEIESDSDTKKIDFKSNDIDEYIVKDDNNDDNDDSEEDDEYIPTSREVIKKIKDLDKLDKDDEKDIEELLEDNKEEKQEEMARRAKKKEKQKKRKKNKGLRIFTAIVIILVVLFGAGVTGAYIFLNSKMSKLNYEHIDTTQIGINEETDKKLKGYRTFAIFGVDSRSDDYEDDDNRSDSIILATLNQDTGEISLVSIYRDTFVDVDENGRTRLDKINHAFAYGGIQNSLKSINNALDLNVREYVAVNFYALIDAVDALGGLDLNITNEEKNVMNSTYIRELNKNLPNERPDYGYIEPIEQAGVQHVNGAQVLAYCRVRYTAGGDYKRTERMRTILNMLLNKVKKLSVTELNKFIDDMLPKVKSNVQTNDVFGLATGVFNYKMSDTNVGWPYTIAGWTGEAWYGVPCTLESNVVKLHQEVYNDPEYEASDEVKDMSSRIIKKTGLTEASGEESNEFVHVEQDLDEE